MHLHELLAIESSVKNQADKCREETKDGFEKKRHLYHAKLVTFRSNDEGVADKTEEQLDLQSTIPEQVDWLREFLENAMDTAYRVAEANTLARGDVTIEGGDTLLEKVPATALLDLEKRVKEIHDFVAAIPTLDPAKGFQPDPERGKGVYKARLEEKTRKKKIQRPLELAAATDKHPAQVQLVSEDVPVGTILTQEWSGLITPAMKATLLARTDTLARAVKQARSRANAQEVPEGKKVGKVLLDFIFQGM